MPIRVRNAIDALGIIRQVQLLANIEWHLSDEPDSLRLHLLVGREIAFHEDFKRVTDDLRILVAKSADAFFQFGERPKIVVQAALYQPSRVGVLRWHCAILT